MGVLDTSAALRATIKHQPKRKETTVKPQRRASKGVAAVPLGDHLCDLLVVFLFRQKLQTKNLKRSI